ncbi:MAG: hypothetical protein H7Y11_01515 [Armatimonadetes bacterium]|nr:hypothetical protein [Anaerolineae bacterium]
MTFAHKLVITLLMGSLLMAGCGGTAPETTPTLVSVVNTPTPLSPPTPDEDNQVFANVTSACDLVTQAEVEAALGFPVFYLEIPNDAEALTDSAVNTSCTYGDENGVSGVSVVLTVYDAPITATAAFDVLQAGSGGAQAVNGVGERAYSFSVPASDASATLSTQMIAQQGTYLVLVSVFGLPEAEQLGRAQQILTQAVTKL